jgi:cyclic pyranopterin phosphate synthase
LNRKFSVRDSFGRTIDYLRLSITDRCNLRCRYCMPDAGVPDLSHHDILSYEEMLRVARVAVDMGVRKIRVTGGEPLVRKGVIDFIARLRALPGNPEITLTTNGLLLGDYARDLKAAGLSRVNVSLDTLRPERFRLITRREGLERVLSGLEAAQRHDLTPLKINMVPIAGVNADEVADFARLTLKHPWDVRFIEFMPVAADLDYGEEQRFAADRILGALAAQGKLEPMSDSRPGSVARLYRYDGGRGRIGVIPAVSQHFCGECNRLRITSDGRVRPCLFSVEELDLRTVLRSSDDDIHLKAVLASAVAAKPEKHRIGESDFKQGPRHMHGIGG